MQSQSMTPVALIPLSAQPLIPFGQVIMIGILAQMKVLQVARATNRNIIAGNTAAVGVGAQNATPTNINT